MLLILFGLPGAGKNYVGRVLAEDFGFHFHDGDDDLPAEMRAAIQNKQAATQAMRDAHTENMIARIGQLSSPRKSPSSILGEGNLKSTAPLEVCGSGEKHIAVGAAFFKERNRLQLLAHYPDAHFVLVETMRDLLLERLARRHNHLADVEYALKIFAFFEPPQAHPYLTLHNVGDRAAVRREVERVLGELLV